MKEIINNLLQNKNFLMFAVTVSYVLGLFAYFTDKPVLFGGIITLFALFLILKEISYKVVIVWVSIFYFGFCNANFRIKGFDELFKLAPANAVLTGQIVSVPNSNIKNNTKFFFKVDKAVVDGETYEHIDNKTLVGINDIKHKSTDFSALVVGNTYEISGKLRRPFISTNPSQFSYSDYLRNYNTYTTFYADIGDVKQIKSDIPFGWKVIRVLNQKRNEIIKTHSKYLESPYIDILGGVVFGDDAVAPPDYIKASFIHSGLLHILAASGMNVAFISGFLMFFLEKAGVPYKIRIISGIFAVILYCLMTGLGASVIRAALMLIFVFFGKLIDRDAHSVALLSFVGMLMLIYNPAYINDVGFQLSFIVTLGIILSLDLILKSSNAFINWLIGSVTIPVIAQLWVIPIQMFYFNTVSLYSVFANILTIPFLQVISFGGFISSVFSLYTPVADFVCKWFDFVIYPCLYILVYISDFFAKLPHSLYYTTHPSVVQVLIYYIILSSVIFLMKIGFKNKKLVISTFVLSIILISSATIHLPNHNFEVISFDVGNADAFLLKSPDNKYFIIDTGKSGYDGRCSQADIIILKYLRDKGIKNIESLVITHFDSDHAGGAVDIINNLSVKNVYVNSVTEKKRLAREIYRAVKLTPDTNLILAKNKEIIYQEKNFCLTNYKANIPQHGHDSEANENSVITYAKNGDVSVLFTGDSGVRAFEMLKKDLPQNITVLKVGHHGAKNVIDKEMVSYFKPKVSLVSVGYNRYGHPYPLTMKLLSGTKIARTDKFHAIKIVSDGKKYELDTFDSQTRKFSKKWGDR